MRCTTLTLRTRCMKPSRGRSIGRIEQRSLWISYRAVDSITHYVAVEDTRTDGVALDLPPLTPSTTVEVTKSDGADLDPPRQTHSAAAAALHHPVRLTTVTTADTLG